MQGNRTIVGVWHTSIKIEALPESFNGLWTFSADGNFLDINTYRETNPGVWIASGDTYHLTFWGFFYDEQGKNFGTGRVSVLIRMDDADHFTADGITNGFDLEGKAMENQFEGPVHLTGERMRIEVPQLNSAP